MFPTTHDITPANVVQSVAVLAGLCGVGNEILVVTKPHLDCVRRLCTALAGYREQILFRFTIGTTNDRILSYWEPNAPRFEERLCSLKYAFDQGFNTSVSCEPMLDKNVEAVIHAVRPYVTDSIWIGRVNQLPASVAINCPGDGRAKKAARALLAEQTDAWIATLYDLWCDDCMIKWKDSIKKVVGLDRPCVKGLDV